MKKRQILAALAMMTACCGTMQAEHTITIKGHVKFIEGDFKMKVMRYEGSGKKVLAETTVDPQTNNYEFKVTVDEPGVAMLDCGSWQGVNVWVQDEDLEVDFRGLDTAKVKIKNPPYVYIRGGRNNELMNLVNFQGHRGYQAMIAISQTVYRAELEDKAKYNFITSGLYDFNNENNEAYYKYLVEHYADRPSVMHAIGCLSYDRNKDFIDAALERLSANDPTGKKLADEYLKQERERKEKLERMKVGAPAPALTFQNEKGKKKKLSDYKGKILVLDFWASWCGPCRAEVPNLKKYYEEFDKSKVEFLSVSIDAKKEAWEKALAEEGMAWQQGWTPDAGKEAMSTYQFNGIPFILVIDAKGNIYRKNVRGESIRQAVQDCLDGVPVEQPKQGKSISMGAMM